MQKIGIVNNREILYLNIRQEKNWREKLPRENWCVFTIANDDDIELIDDAISKCLDNVVTYTCSVGQLAGVTELSFDTEIVKRQADDHEDETEKPYGYYKYPVTTTHYNFSKGFWYSTTVANVIYTEINKVVCLDFTIKGVKQHLTELVNKINNGWQPSPSDEEVEEPKYDR